MNDIKILWVDDEIDFLKPHILFLEKKGYKVDACTNGTDAIDMCDSNTYDMVFLDEHMPGISGLDVLLDIKTKQPSLPIVMITKSEEEHLMEEAIGNKISDYLIKPVNPNQILLSLKKNLDHNRLVSEKTTLNYQQEFRKIAMELATVNSFEDWIALYKKIIYWELELDLITDSNMTEILASQKLEANSLFFKFIKATYQDWITDESIAPTLSHNVFKKLIFPVVENNKGTLVLVIDNLRYDQFMLVEDCIAPFYKKEKEHSYFSILPTATQYARNAIFSGLTPLEMQQKHPSYWKNDTDDGGKNLFEKEFFEKQLDRLHKNYKFSFHKIANLKSGKLLVDAINSLKENDLNIIVYNFVDMLSHAKTEMEVIKELAGDDKAFRSLTVSWFKNSPLLDIVQKAADLQLKLIITTDHGTINVDNPSKVIGDKNISANLRYKTGRSLSFNDKEVFHVANPHDFQLPSSSMNSSFIFAKENYFFAYPNNFNHYVKYYRNTYQHGGISLEEMIIPCAIFAPK